MRHFLSLAAIFSLSFSLAGDARAEVSVGDDVPNFEMVGSDGKTYTNQQFKGKKFIVIAWYPKAFTGG